MKVAEVINLGDELLLGIRENSHLAYLGGQLSAHCVQLRWSQVVRDEPEDIREAFETAWTRADLVITTGGLGPTLDDVARESIAKALGTELVYCDEVEEALRTRFARMGRQLSANNLRQAYRPDGSELVPNHHGTAPGLWYEKDGKVLVMLPGPSHEMRPMFEEHVMPRLEERGFSRRASSRLQLRTFGLAESHVENELRPLYEPHLDQLEVAFCAHAGIIDVRFSPRRDDCCPDVLQRVAKECRRKLGEDFFGQGNICLPRIAIERLRALERTLSVAESCTGGLLADSFTDVAGASKVFEGGVVCYSNAAKTEMLGVPEEIIYQHGAVSAETAVAMATGAAERFGTDYALSVTGFAGPGGGTPEHPIGTIFLGFCAPMGVWSRKISYPGNRLAVKQRAVNTALDWLRRKLGKYLVHDLMQALPTDLRVVDRNGWHEVG